jgi:outer membrane protein assembly factor BamA
MRRSAVHFRLTLAFLLTLFLPLACAQTRKRASAGAMPSSFKLSAIKVAGSKRYSAQDVIAATGLQIGQMVVDDDFKRVTQQLGETGAFSSVAYSFEYSGEGAKLSLQVSDADQFVPAQFENFVWLSERELRAKLHSLTPLFEGQLPLTGSLADQISEDLQVFLSENNLPGHVNYLRAGVENGPIDAIVFSVSDVDIRIQNVAFTGAAAAELPALQAAAERLQDEEFSRSAIHIQIEKDLLPVYWARGYLKAAITDAETKAIQSDSKQTDVDITFAVDPGRQYQVKEIQLSGAKVIPADQLQKMIHQQPGKPADAVRLGRDIEAMTKFYGTHGYMAASVQAMPAVDDAASTVSYRIAIQEGEQYHMGELEIRGLDSRVTDRLQLKWKLRPGDPYDSSYLHSFLDETRDQLPGDWDISVHETPEAKDKTVDVTLRFDRKS